MPLTRTTCHLPISLDGLVPGPAQGRDDPVGVVFGPVRGTWDEDWRGWWGDEPPYHAPVFVLTDHPHPPIELQGGTTFHLVTQGVRRGPPAGEGRRRRRRRRHRGRCLDGAPALAAGAVDELVLDVVPVLLGSGELLFEGVADPGFEPAEVVHSTRATHIRYRVGRA
jgi:hypothetical protein